MQLTDKLGRILTGLGMYEIKNFSFVSPKLLDRLGLAADDPRREQLRLLNPLGEDTSVMRSTLVPSMLQTLALNQNRGNEQAMLYEIAPVFDASARTGKDYQTSIGCCLSALTARRSISTQCATP